MKNDSTPEEELSLENELTASDLDLKYQAPNPISEDASPELVGQWLDQVLQYEEEYPKGPKISVYEFIGRPELMPAAELDDEEYLEAQIDFLLDLFEEHNILIDRPAHLTSKGYYRFLLDDFLPSQTVNPSLKEMVHAFFYDQFRHDSPEFIRSHVEDCLLELLYLDEPFQGIWLSRYCRTETEVISKAEAIERIAAFRDQYHQLIPVSFQAEGVKRTPAGFYFIFGLAWQGIPKNTTKKECHEGMGVCQVAFEEGEWRVQGILMPGFSL